MRGLRVSTATVGAVLVILSTGMMAAADGIAKLFAGQYAAPQLFALSAGLVVAFSVFGARASGERLTITSRGPMIWRAGLTVLASVAFYMAFRLLPFADVFLFVALIPLIAAVLSGPVLNEVPRPSAWAALALGAGGVICMLPGGVTGLAAGHLWALVAALSGTGALLAARVIGLRERAPMAQVFWPNLALLVVMACALPFVWRPMGLVDVVWVAVYALALFGARYVVAEAMRLLPAYVATPLMNLQFVWMVTIGFVFFGEVPGIGTVLGAALVVGSGGWLVVEDHIGRLRAARMVPAE
ncbi:DMT family transporter [Sagittula sp. SSi028]|uniref:DMT family transporter n=1 Tax=Sagittula sp. SSi028 TaxID=3400636 RepID=UPI003AF5C678